MPHTETTDTPYVVFQTLSTVDSATGAVATSHTAVLGRFATHAGAALFIRALDLGIRDENGVWRENVNGVEFATWWTNDPWETMGN